MGLNYVILFHLLLFIVERMNEIKVVSSSSNKNADTLSSSVY